ncbi:unnamed protein product, partial [Medioppia subpectinata]
MLIDIDFALESQNSIILDENDYSETNEHHITNEDKSVNRNDLSGFMNKRKLSDSECCEYLSKRHCNLSSTRNHLLDKWYEKTRFTSNAFKNKSLVGLEQSSTQQIGRILSDMERLTDIDEKAINDNELNVESIDKSDGNEVDAEIFDDDDFYHQLLRELIESKTGSQANDPMILSKKWLEIQKLRNKIKRKVDTKASKGRKIRYDVHSKLVNFMAPINNETFTESATNDLKGSEESFVGKTRALSSVPKDHQFLRTSNYDEGSQQESQTPDLFPLQVSRQERYPSSTASMSFPKLYLLQLLSN